MHPFAAITCCKLGAYPETRFWQHSWWILVHFSWAIVSSFIIFLGLCATTTFFNSHQDCFYEIQVRRQWWPLYYLPGPLKPSLGGLWGMRRIIVLLDSPVTPKLQLPHRWYSIFSQDLLILDSIHLAPENHWATTLLYCSQGVLWSGCLILPSPAILLIHRPKTSFNNRIIIKSFN